MFGHRQVPVGDATLLVAETVDPAAPLVLNMRADEVWQHIADFAGLTSGTNTDKELDA